MSRNDWILAFHLLSAFALVASMVLFWTLVVATRTLTDVDQRIVYGRIGDFGGRVIGIGFAGTIIFGVWLAFSKDSFAIWDGWIVAAIILWVIGGAAGGRAGAEYQKVLDQAREMKSAGQSAQPGAFRSASGELMLAISSLAILLILIDMIWKPGAPALADLRPNNFNFPLVVHVGGATLLVGGVMTAAIALSVAGGNVKQLRFGYFSLLFVGLPGYVLAKLGATAIWSKESPHSFIGSAFPHRNDPRWIEIGGTALDGGGALLVLALILGWFGLKRMEGATGDLLTKFPVVSKMTGETLLRLTKLITIILLVGYVLAVWAMGGKPG